MKIFAFIFAFVLSLSVLSFSVSANDLPTISANGAILMDSLTGEIIFEKNAKTKLPMASTTKIMSAMLALECGNLDEKFVVDKNAIKVEGSSMGLKEGDIVTMRTLVYGMLLPSGNDAANAAAVRLCGSVEAFVQKMNLRAKELGLTSTHFVTPSGLDDNTDEHYSTAYDIALLTREALKNPDFCEICKKYTAKLEFGNPPYERWLTNNNKLLNTCEGVIGVKTGFTDKAKRCLVSACKRNGATLICVTLNDPNDWLDHSKLFDYGFGMFETQTLSLESTKIAVNTVGGKADTVVCKTKKVSVSMLRNRSDKVKAEIYTDPFVYAPVADNAVVGKVRYIYDNQLICEEPIYTAQTVAIKESEQNAGFFQTCYDKLRNCFS